MLNNVTIDINQQIYNWHTKFSLSDPFSDFVFEYLAFIAYLKRILFVNAKNDRDAIQKLKRDYRIEKLYLQRIRDDKKLKNEWECIINELNEIRLGNVSQNSGETEEIKWWNCRGEVLNYQSGLQLNMEKGVIHGLRDWGNMIEFWYSIRNNLFHGGKDPQNDRDYLLAEKGFKTLHELVDIFLSNDLCM